MTVNMRRAAATAVGLLLAGFAGLASAAPDYCVGGTPSAGLDLGDATFGVPADSAASADDCWGAATGADDIAAINALAWDVGPGGADTNDWVKVAGTGFAANGEGDLWLGEFRFDLSPLSSDSDDGEPWSYKLTWFDTDPSHASVIDPVDMVFVGAQSESYAAWLFRDIAFTDGSVGGGTFRIDFASVPGFSGASVYVRHGAPAGIARTLAATQAVPEPDVLAIFGLGLCLLGFARIGRPRRRPALTPRADAPR